MSGTEAVEVEPWDTRTLVAAIKALCVECQHDPGFYDAVETLVWMHHPDGDECEASALRVAMDPYGMVFGGSYCRHQCPTCGFLSVDERPVPCCEECHVDRFA